MSHKHEYLPPAHEEPDAWHRHSADEGAPQQEHAATVNAAILTLVFVACLVFVAATIAASIMYFRVHTNNLKIARIENTAMSKDALDYRNTTRQRITTFYWGDPAAAQANVVSLPIGDAIDKVVEKYNTSR